MDRWEFWIDVGGTFTDCLARKPDGTILSFKTLSSGVTKGQVTGWENDTAFFDPLRENDPPSFWCGYTIRFLDVSGNPLFESQIIEFDVTGRLTIADQIPATVNLAASYELFSHEEAPLVAIRYLLQLGLYDEIPEITVKLGTTRGTNALLTRTGANTAFVTTCGMADILLIGNQDRPKLFALDIKKPTPLFTRVLEVDERLSANGEVLSPLNEQRIRVDLEQIRNEGIESIAICLLHSYMNPEHELIVEQIARDVGFTEISTSSRLSPTIKIVSRGDTTVMDAYLNPILRQYIQSLQSPLKNGSLKVMTSAGGLVDAANFVGKDSILSGPAGGVNGFAQAAKQAGFTRSFGFDMGGTSTDVSRYDGEFEYEYETEKAGVRIVSPMLAIETVAAGGGSICGFDGVKLFVGPNSAGADPGPACYGKGGPLTVTDMNLHLGRIISGQFPFPLDDKMVARKLATLCEEITNSPLGKQYTTHELAEGFLEIANETMARAIRRISVAKGYDPADYILVTFGGAGAQHACAISRLLGISQTLIHPCSGILSAYGIGQADVRRFASQTILEPFNVEMLEQLNTDFSDLESQVFNDVLAEGVPDDAIQSPNRSLDIRYQGAESTITILQPDDGDYRTAFERKHQQYFGYLHTDRPLEIVTLRVEVVGRMPQTSVPAQTRCPGEPEPFGTSNVWFGGNSYETPLFRREQLGPGNTIHGPSILCEATSTIVVEPGFSAQVTASGDVILTDSVGDRQPNAELQKNDDVDPVMLEIFNNLFASIAEQMGETLQRTSISINVKERLDFSCALFESNGDLVVNAPHIPVHLGAMSETVKHILRDNPDIRPGDVFVTNDPYRGGSHLPDITVVTPVHDEHSGELLFVTASRAHHAEIGGIVPGSMPPFSRNLAEEGVIIRNFKLVGEGRLRIEELKTRLASGPYPSRSISDNLADIAAQVAANQIGVRLLKELIGRYSLPVVQAYMRHIQKAAAEKMRMALQSLEDGRYTFSDYLDDEAEICVQIDIQNESATVDFSDTSGVLSSNLNANHAIVTAAVLYVFRCLIDEEIPLNSGVLEPVTIHVPESMLNPPERERPEDCAAMAGGNVETSQRIVDVLLGALGMAAASQGTMNNLTFGNDSFGYYETICGGSGATKAADGADAVHTHMTNTRLTDVEVIEHRYPVRVREFRIRKGSGGAGQHCGGDGIVRRLEFLKPLKVSMLTERRGQFSPYGLTGGRPGQTGVNTMLKAMTGEHQNMGGKFQLDAHSGDQLIIETPGGGGFGDACQNPKE